MTPEEMAQQYKSQLDAAVEKATAAETKAAEQASQIKNLDESVKAQEATINSLRKAMKDSPKSLKAMIAAGLEEKREEIMNKCAEHKNGGSFTVELKVASPTAPTLAVPVSSIAMDPTVHGVPVLNNAFLLSFGVTEADGASLAWVEASDSKSIGYVQELASNANNSDITFAEKTRKFAKLATYINLSSESADFFGAIVDYAENRVPELLDSYFDAEVWGGAGADATKPLEVYGLKNSATAFSKLTTYSNPTIGDVIEDGIMQVANAGFNANVVILNHAELAQLRAVKDTAGNLIYNQYTQMFGQVRVVPSANIEAGAMLIADTRCVDIKKGKTLEIEFTRKADIDGWRVDFRRRGQVKVATADQKGLCYVASVSAAITAITA